MHFAELDAADVVRHRLVSDIVDAYGRWDETSEPGRAVRGPRDAARARVSIEVNNETGVDRRRGRAGRAVPGSSSTPDAGPPAGRAVHPAWSTSRPMETLHMQWMDLPGPTDV